MTTKSEDYIYGAKIKSSTLNEGERWQRRNVPKKYNPHLFCLFSPPSYYFFYFGFKKYNPHFLLSPYTSFKGTWIFLFWLPKNIILTFCFHLPQEYYFLNFGCNKNIHYFLLSPFTSLKTTIFKFWLQKI